MQCVIRVYNKNLRSLITSKGHIKLANGVGFIELDSADEVEPFSKELSKFAAVEAIKSEEEKQQANDEAAKGQDEGNELGTGNVGSAQSFNFNNLVKGSNPLPSVE